MKAQGPREERETIIRFAENSYEVTIWTASDKVYRKCKRLGFDVIDEGERHAEFRLTLKNLRLVRAVVVSDEEKVRRAELARQTLSAYGRKQAN